MRSRIFVRRTARRALLVLLALAPVGSAADEWLVYVGGGVELIGGAWTERRADVMFTQRGGTLVSVPYEDVDLATSTFITWQLNGRRRMPPRAGLPPDTASNDPAAPDRDSSCTPARVVALSGGETFDIRYGDVRERVHAACLDAPETDHRFVELGWFGRAMVSAVRLEFDLGAEICVAEQSPPLTDEEGHRVVHVTLEGGQDYSREVIAAGLGLLRPARCDRAAEYRVLENRAISEQRGLWGEMGARPAIAAANLVVSVGPESGSGARMAAPRRSGGG